MRSEYFAVFIGKFTLFKGFSAVASDKFCIVTVRNKADILTVVLSCIDKAVFLGNFTNL